MILKVFRDRPRDSGWVFVDGVEEVQVDVSTYCFAENEDKSVGIYAIGNQTADGREFEVDREHRMVDYRLMFMPSGEEKLPERVTAITVGFANDEWKTFITRQDISSYVLSDKGDTIERI
jgi:hypothetical protein